MDDHARNCRGREYECTCGFDDQQSALLKALAGLFRDAWNGGYDFQRHTFDRMVKAGLLKEASHPDGGGYAITDLGRQAIAVAEEPGRG